MRNDVIYAKWRGGRSLASLAEEYDRAPQVIGRIVAERHPDLEDDTDRALHRGRLETLYEEVQAVVDAPGWKLAPNGRMAEDEDGNPLVDIGAKIEGLKLKLLVLESARKLDARDKPQRKILTTEHSVAEQQMLAAIEARRREMEALARKAALPATIPGEVLRELPPAAAPHPAD